MDRLPDNAQKPEAKTYDAGPWEMGVMMMVGITLWMASMDDLPPEAYAFYVIFARGTMCGILACLAHRLYTSWAFQREVLIWNEAQREAKASRKPNEGMTEFSRKMPFSYWDMASRAHPSAFLSTTLIQPRLFPFPMGIAETKTPSLYWESGLQPQVGRFKASTAYSKQKREAYAKEVSTKVKDWDKAEEERNKYYAEQRRILTNRVWHIKVISVIVVMGFVSKRLAILALIPFCYSLFTTEITVLLQGKKSTYKHKKLPRAARVNKENYVQPGMGIGYIYEPDSGHGKGPQPLGAMPILDSAPVLLTSADPRLAGDNAPVKTQPTWFKYESENLDSGAGGSDGKGKSKGEDGKDGGKEGDKGAKK